MNILTIKPIIMLLRNLLSDLNNMLIDQAFEVLDMICIDEHRNGSGNWDIAVVRGNRVETSSIMYLQGKFITDTFIHKNMEVLFNLKVEPKLTPEQLDIQRIELAMKISIEFHLN